MIHGVEVSDPPLFPLAVRFFFSRTGAVGLGFLLFFFFARSALVNAAQNFTEWAAFTLVGTVFIGSVLHHWYNFLDR